MTSDEMLDGENLFTPSSAFDELQLWLALSVAVPVMTSAYASRWATLGSTYADMLTAIGETRLSNRVTTALVAWT
jgi:hypothetical protein